MKKKIIFRPELLLEFHLDATQKKSTLTVKNKNDAVFVLEGIKKLTTDHLALIFLDKKDVVVGVETFLCTIDKFDNTHASRAISSILYKQNRDPMLKVVIAQTRPKKKKLSMDDLGIKGLVKFSLRALAFGVELVDCILIGKESYYSFKEDAKGWEKYKKSVKSMKKLLSKEPFFPELFDMEEDE